LARTPAFERSPDADLHAASGQFAGGVLAELRRNLWEDRRRCVDENPPGRDLAQPRVVAQGVAHQIGELGESLDARVPGADEHERQVTPCAGDVGTGVRQLQLAQHVVTQCDRVGEILEAVAVLGETGNWERAADRPERDHQPVVRELERSVGRFDRDRPALPVEGRSAAQQELGARAHHPQRHDHVTGLERARGSLGQERREEHEVLRTDDRRLGAALAEQPCNPAAGKAAAED
jgi:hypothetical protein